MFLVFSQNKKSKQIIALLTAIVFIVASIFPLSSYAEEDEEVVETIEEVEEVSEPVEDPEEGVELESEPEPEEVSEEEEVEDDEEGTSIVTGDAGAGTVIGNEVNTNITQINSTGTSTPDELDESEGVPDPEYIEDPQLTSSDPTCLGPPATQFSEGGCLVATTTSDGSDVGGNGTTTVTNTNDADINNQATTTAETGDNTADDSVGDVSIDTSNAVATAQVINVVNTNIFNSYGFFLFLNQIASGDFDMRDLFADLFLVPQVVETQDDDCDGGCGDGGFTQITNTNSAVISNSVVVRADTGNNSASGEGENSIETGDAYAAAQVMNIVNTNITNSNYLLMTFNSFGNSSDDIVFPAAQYLSGMFGGGGLCSADELHISNTNNADVENNVDVVANTGDNSATSSATSVIETGDAYASIDVTNVINTNLTCSDSFSMLFNFHGSWAGNIFGAPAGLTWTETTSGVSLHFGPEIGGSTAGTLDVTNTNDATIHNDIEVIALTGDNRVVGESTTIDTGDAYASASVLNVVNTNVVGRNWALAVFNIFGDWGGNITFGRPDLWIGGVAEVPGGYLMPGDDVTLRFTVFNNGDADATNVLLSSDFQTPYLSVRDPGSNAFTAGAASGDGLDVWELGTIAAGESTEVSFVATVSDDGPTDRSSLSLLASVEASEPDENMDDNSEELSLLVGEAVVNSSGSSSGRSTPSDPPELLVEKTASVGMIAASSTVGYTIVITNDGGRAFDALLVDQLINEDGEVVSEQIWDFNSVYEDEEITVTYDTLFVASTTPGVYTNEAFILAYGGYGMGHSASYEIESNIALATVEVVVLAEPDVHIIKGEENEEEIAGAFIEDVAAGIFENSGTRRAHASVNNISPYTPLPFTEAAAGSTNLLLLLSSLLLLIVARLLYLENRERFTL